jgi:hypothetical protein
MIFFSSYKLRFALRIFNPQTMEETMLRTLTLLGVFASVAGHGSMIMPPSRNSIDASPGMPWAGGKHPETGSMICIPAHMILIAMTSRACTLAVIAPAHIIRQETIRPVESCSGVALKGSTRAGFGNTVD